jgi:ribosome-associated protein
MTSTPSKPATKTKPAIKTAVKKAATKSASGTAAKKAVKKVVAKTAAKPAAKKAAAKAPVKARAEAKPMVAKPAPELSDVLADLAVAALEDLKAVDIKRLDVRGLTTITDVMIIATGTSNRHAASLAHSVIDKAKESGHRPVGIEGMNEGEWVLVNLGGVIVHVMQAQPRAFYQLEKLWDFQTRESAVHSA